MACGKSGAGGEGDCQGGKRSLQHKTGSLCVNRSFDRRYKEPRAPCGFSFSCALVLQKSGEDKAGQCGGRKAPGRQIVVTAPTARTAPVGAPVCDPPTGSSLMASVPPAMAATRSSGKVMSIDAQGARLRRKACQHHKQLVLCRDLRDEAWCERFNCLVLRIGHKHGHSNHGRSGRPGQHTPERPAL